MVEPPYHPMCEYFPSFRQLTHFSIFSSHISLSPQQLGLFSAFQCTLSHISLTGCTVTKSALVALISYFPNLIRIALHDIDHHKDDEPIPPPPRTHFKRLWVSDWDADSLDLVDELSKLRLHFEEIVIIGSLAAGPEFVERIVGAFGANTECLRLFAIPGGVHNHPNTPLLNPLSHPFYRYGTPISARALSKTPPAPILRAGPGLQGIQSCRFLVHNLHKDRQDRTHSLNHAPPPSEPRLLDTTRRYSDSVGRAIGTRAKAGSGVPEYHSSVARGVGPRGIPADVCSEGPDGNFRYQGRADLLFRWCWWTEMIGGIYVRGTAIMILTTSRFNIIGSLYILIYQTTTTPEFWRGSLTVA